MKKDNMQQKNKNILFFLNSVLHVRSLYDSGFLKKLNDTHHIRVIFNSTARPYDEVQKIAKDGIIQDVSFYTCKTRRVKILSELITLSWFEFRNRSNALDVKKNRIRRRKRLFYYLISTPTFIAKLITRAALVLLSSDADLVDIIKKIRPDVVCIDSSLNEYFTIEVLLAARASGIKTCVIAHNWDNLVTKGTIIVKPDILCVWGGQHFEQAVRVQQLEKERVRILGAPAFEIYHNNKHAGLLKKKFYELYGFSSNDRVILLCGSCYAFDELTVLKSLDEILGQKNLTNIKLVYRPHPWGCDRKNEVHFDTLKLGNVVMDKQMESIYNSRFNEYGELSTGDLPVVAPDMGYYNMMLKSIDGIIAPYTTLLVEAALNRVPMILLGYFDGLNTAIPGDQLSSFLHARDFIQRAALKECKEPKQIEETFLHLLKLMDDEPAKDRIWEAGRHIVQVDHETCVDRMRRILDELISDHQSI